jgi:hypothetical protein
MGGVFDGWQERSSIFAILANAGPVPPATIVLQG